MIKKRSARTALLACVGLVSLGLIAGAAPATAKTKKKTVTRTATVSQCIDVASAIVDRKATTASIPVTLPKFKGQPQDGTVTGVSSVGLRLTHELPGDLVIGLVSPGARYVALANSRGSGTSLGSGAASCGGGLTTFSDSAGTAIGDATPPFAGSFRPEQPLSQLVGAPARGTWQLVVNDCCNADQGTLHAFSLSVTYQYKAQVKKKAKKKN